MQLPSAIRLRSVQCLSPGDRGSFSFSRGNTAVHISPSGSLGSLRLLGTPLQHDCELRVSKRCTEQLFTALSIWSLPFLLSVKMSQQLNFTPAFFSHLKCPFTTWQLPPGQYPFKCQLNPGCEAEGRSHRDHVPFEQRFSDPTSSCWGKERNHLPSHGWVKQPLYSRRAAAKPKAAKGGVEQLSQDAAVIPWGHCLQHKLHHQPECKCDPLAPGLLWGSKAASPLIPSSCGCVQGWCSPAVPQLPLAAALTSAPVRTNQLCGTLWAESWASGLAPSSQWELRAGMGVHQLLLPTGDEDLQNGGDSHGYTWLWISLHSVCTCSCAVCSAWIYCFLYHWSYICLSLQCL